MIELLLLLHAGATCALTGLIWFVQRVHYPLFGRVGEEQFAAYEEEHQQRTTWVVAPLMLTELGCALALVLLAEPGERGWWLAAGGLLGLIWASTAWVQVPLHRGLSGRFDPSDHQRLVATNWVRTIAWTVRSVMALLPLAALIEGRP